MILFHPLISYLTKVDVFGKQIVFISFLEKLFQVAFKLIIYYFSIIFPLLF